MLDSRHLETLLQDAIALLEESGFPMAAETLRDNLRRIRTAPTGGARRRRIFQLRDLFEGMGPGPETLRYRRSDAQGCDQARYRKTLEAIQDLLASGVPDDGADGSWGVSNARVA